MIQRINYLRDNGVISFEKVSRDAIRAKREEKWSSLTQVCLFFMGIRMCSNVHVKWKASKFEDSDTCIYKKKESYRPKIYFRGTNEPFSLSQKTERIFFSPLLPKRVRQLDEYIRNIRKVLGGGEEPEDNRRGWATALSDIRWNRNDEPLHFRCAVSLAPIDDWPLDSPSNRSNAIVDR